MPTNYSSTTPIASAPNKNALYKTDGSNVAFWYSLDIKSTSKSASGTIEVLAVETVELVTSGSPSVTRTLPPAASCPDCIVTEKKIDSGGGIVTIQAAGSPAELIDTIYTYLELTNQNQYVRLLSDGTGWNVIGNN
jgi:hypothetical protein